MKLTQKLGTLLFAASAALGLASCGGGGGGGSGGGSGGTTPPPVITPVPTATEALITGTLKDARSGLPVADAQVSIGKLVTVSGVDGSFAVDKVPLGRTLIQIDSPRYAQGAFVAYTTAQSAQPNLAFQLLPVESTISFDAASAQTLKSSSSPATVVLSGASLASSSGAAPVGQVVVKISSVDAKAMPGDFTTSASAMIETFGALDVSFADANNNPLNLASGKTATIRIPAKASGSTAPPATIALYYFNTSTGYWVREGSATLVTSAAGNYYEGSVSHFTTWNADEPAEAVRLTGRVLDIDGVPVSGATVLCTGLDYSGTTTAASDTQGNFSAMVKKSSNVECFVRFNTTETARSKLSVGAQDMAVGNTELPISRASTITLGDTAKRVDSNVYPLGGSLAVEMQIPFESAGITLDWDAIKAGHTWWEVTPVFAPDGSSGSFGAGKDGTSDRTFTNRVDNGSTPNKGIMSFSGSVRLGSDAVAMNQTTLTFIVRLVGTQKSATTGLYSEVRSPPKQYKISLVRSPLVANGLTWLPMTDRVYLYGEAVAFCASSGYRLPTKAEALNFFPDGPWGTSSGSSINPVWTSTLAPTPPNDATKPDGSMFHYVYVVSPNNSDKQKTLTAVSDEGWPSGWTPGLLAICVK